MRTRARIARALLGLLLGLALAAACNPLDPDKIKPEQQEDASVAPDAKPASPCSPACTSTQYCLKTTAGGCGCFESCDPGGAGCSTGQGCAVDPSAGDTCIDLANDVCK